MIGADETEILVNDLFGNNKDLKDQFMNLLYTREVNRRHNSWFTKPISEFSLASKYPTALTILDCKIIDKSYTAFPSDFHELICSGMDDIGREILNTKWVSVPRGSEYFSFHIKNQHEEQLFMCEDERYELDSYLNMTRSTLEALYRLKAEHDKNPDMSDEEFVEFRDKLVGSTKIKWIKHIYN